MRPDFVVAGKSRIVDRVSLVASGIEAVANIGCLRRPVPGAASALLLAVASDETSVVVVVTLDASVAAAKTVAPLSVVAVGSIESLAATTVAVVAARMKSDA
jgi:hypothetical protein